MHACKSKKNQRQAIASIESFTCLYTHISKTKKQKTKLISKKTNKKNYQISNKFGAIRDISM